MSEKVEEENVWFSLLKCREEICWGFNLNFNVSHCEFLLKEERYSWKKMQSKMENVIMEKFCNKKKSHCEVVWRGVIIRRKMNM